MSPRIRFRIKAGIRSATRRSTTRNADRRGRRSSRHRWRVDAARPLRRRSRRIATRDAGSPAACRDAAHGVDRYTQTGCDAPRDRCGAAINDVNVAGAGCVDAVASSGCYVCGAYARRAGDMQQSPFYDDVVREVVGYLEQRVAACRDAGIRRADRRDPGFGFGRRSRHNLRLLRVWVSSQRIGSPILAGLSRKGCRRVHQPAGRSARPCGRRRRAGGSRARRGDRSYP